MLLGATNAADLLDPALVRHGRFGPPIQIPPPDRAGRAALFRVSPWRRMCRWRPCAWTATWRPVHGRRTGARRQKRANGAARSAPLALGRLLRAQVRFTAELVAGERLLVRRHYLALPYVPGEERARRGGPEAGGHRPGPGRPRAARAARDGGCGAGPPGAAPPALGRRRAVRPPGAGWVGTEPRRACGGGPAAAGGPAAGPGARGRREARGPPAGRAAARPRGRRDRLAAGGAHGRARPPLPLSGRGLCRTAPAAPAAGGRRRPAAARDPAARHGGRRRAPAGQARGLVYRSGPGRRRGPTGCVRRRADSPGHGPGPRLPLGGHGAATGVRRRGCWRPSWRRGSSRSAWPPCSSGRRSAPPFGSGCRGRCSGATWTATPLRCSSPSPPPSCWTPRGPCGAETSPPRASCWRTSGSSPPGTRCSWPPPARASRTPSRPWPPRRASPAGRWWPSTPRPTSTGAGARRWAGSTWCWLSARRRGSTPVPSACRHRASRRGRPAARLAED